MQPFDVQAPDLQERRDSGEPGPPGAESQGLALPSADTLLEKLAVGVGCISLDGRWQSANHKLCELLAQPRERLLGRAIRDVLCVLDALPWQALLARVLAGQELPAPVELQCLLGDGRRTWFELNLSLIRDAAGGAAAFACVIEDISWRKSVEQAQLERASKLDAIVSNSPSALSLKTPEGHYALANPNLQRILGRSESDIVGRSDYELYPEAVAAAFRANDDLVLQTQDRHSIEERVPVQGRMRLFQSHMFPVFDGAGQVRYICRISLDITDKRRAEQNAEFLAFHDPLTRLPNRQLLHNRLEQALVRSLRSGRKGALLLLDLDDFKSINDTLGHDSGDLLLHLAAQRLTRTLRHGDTVARMGGDEFVLLLDELDGDLLAAAEQVKQVAGKVLAALHQPFALHDQERVVSCSMGAMLFGERPRTPEEVLRCVDVALYDAKRAGRDMLRFFDQHIQDALSARAALEQQLRHAVARNELRLHFQLQVDQHHHPLGAEALVRWQHPERGLLAPVHFIPLAEETGLVALIGRWVAEQACAQLACWSGQPGLDALTMSINVSARELRQPGFVGHLLDAVARHGVPAGRLEVELTESSLLEDVESAGAALQALAAAGIGIALDDFGTGYSSLTHLKRLPIRQLKIDQSFVRDIASDASDRTIVSTIIAMAGSLGLGVIAEGVETAEQLDFLKAHGCRQFQGFLFGRPAAVDQFEAALATLPR